MLTFFTVPKGFDEPHLATIQTNALASWRAALPDGRILVYGDDPGVAAVTRRHGGEHVADVRRNDRGTPLIGPIFLDAQRRAPDGLLCYVNTDIVLTPALVEVAADVWSRHDRFLLVARRWDTDIAQWLPIGEPGWVHDVEARARAGRLHWSTGIDVFCFTPGLWPHVPDFAVGRTKWDNWLVRTALDHGAAVVDATARVTVAHQAHHYGTGGHRAASKQDWTGEERKVNEALAGDRYATIADATHTLAPASLDLGLRAAMVRSNASERFWRWRTRAADAMGIDADLRLRRWPAATARWLLRRRR